ncbi:MAG: heme ABC transporter ATP-binding protein [Pseudomonadota bacterium]
MTIRADDISVSSGNKVRLSNVSLALQPGQLVVAIGPNGAGKSTLLKALSGQLPIQSGSVTLDAIPINEWGKQALARRRAVFSQHTNVAFDFTVEEVIMLGRGPFSHGAETHSDWQMVEQIIDELDLGALRHRICNQLSGGEQQRVQIARVLVQSDSVSDATGIFFMDEPTSSLDIEHQHQVMDLLRRRTHNGSTVFAVLHDLNLAATYADEIIIVDQGRQIAAGAPWDVMKTDLLDTVFSANFTVVTHPVSGVPALLTSSPISGRNTRGVPAETSPTGQ